MDVGSENKNKKATRIISAGIIIYRHTKEGLKFLLLYHGRNYWNFPKGKLEENERSWQAAFREVKEETGLKASDLKQVSNFKTFEKSFYEREGERIFKVVILYLAETSQSQIVLSDEHEGYAWFKFGEAEKILARYKDSQNILRKAHTFLKNRQKKNMSAQP